MTSAQIESRLIAREREVARLKAQIALAPNRGNNWVEAVAGTFANDSVFDDAMRLGRQWRQAQRPRSRRSKSRKPSSIRRGPVK